MQEEQISKEDIDIRLIYEIGQQITSTLEFDSIFHSLHENIHKLMDATTFGIRLYHPDKNLVEYKYEIEKGERFDSEFVTMDDDDNYSVWCIKNKKEVFLNDNQNEYHKYTNQIKVVSGEMPHSLMFVPIINQGKVLGLITVQSFDKFAYTKRHLEILKILASFAGIAMSNAKAHNITEDIVKERTFALEDQKKEVEKTFENIKLLSEIGQEITSTRSVEEIIEKVYTNVNLLMDASVFGIGIYNEEERSIEFPGMMEKGVRFDKVTQDIDKEGSPAPLCFKNNTEVIMNDMMIDYPKYFPHSTFDVIAGDMPESIIYLPLTHNDKKIGVITVQSFKSNAYTESHINFLRNLAVFCTIAIDNARLYNEMEEEIKVQTEEVTKQKEELEKSYRDTRLLAEIAQDISSSLSVEDIISKAYAKINLILNAEVFGIGIVNEAKGRIEIRGLYENGVRMDDFHYNLDDERLAAICYRRRESLIINDYQTEYSNYIQQLAAPVSGKDASSIIYIPLLHKEDVIGVFTIQSFQKNVYTEYEVNLSHSIAHAISIAIENALIYESVEKEVEERTEEVTVQKEQIEKAYKNVERLSEISKEISQILNIEDIVLKLYEKLNDIMDAAVFGIGVYDKKNEQIVFPSILENGERMPEMAQGVNDDRFGPLAFRRKEELIILDLEKEYKQYFPEMLLPPFGKRTDSILYIPLMSKGEAIGLITIQSFEVNAYSEYEINLVRSIAVSAAIAVENALLYEGMEEEIKQRTQEVVEQKEKIEKAYNDTKLLAEISQDIASSLSIQEIIEKAYTKVNSVMRAECFGIGLYENNTKRILMPGLYERGQRMDDFYYELEDERLAVWCFKNQKEIFINDYFVEYNNYLNNIKAPVSGDDASSIIYLPLFVKGKIFGVITVQSFEKNVYQEYHLDFLRSIAHSVSIALENARLYSEMEDEVKERTAEVIKQKEVIEEKNKDILDSILYARKIQNAMLTSKDYFNKILPEHFVLSIARDIVSGDFYWGYETKDGRVIWAVVDCTGHGVPGAFMSMIGNSLLNEIIIENGIYQPDQILNTLRDGIITSLNQTGKAGESKDGMDVAICVWDKESNKLEFSGANNPLYIVRNGELIIYRPDKMPIGYYGDIQDPFTLQEVDLQKGDMIYIFSDGYADQFGGADGKKLKSYAFQNLLVEISKEEMMDQKRTLVDKFHQWKGDNEQLDDICILGAKVI